MNVQFLTEKEVPQIPKMIIHADANELQGRLAFVGGRGETLFPVPPKEFDQAMRDGIGIKPHWVVLVKPDHCACDWCSGMKAENTAASYMVVGGEEGIYTYNIWRDYPGETDGWEIAPRVTDDLLADLQKFEGYGDPLLRGKAMLDSI